MAGDSVALIISGAKTTHKNRDSFTKNNVTRSDGNRNQHPPPPPALINKVFSPSHHPCEHFAFPPPPPPGLRRPGPRRKFNLLALFLFPLLILVRDWKSCVARIIIIIDHASDVSPASLNLIVVH